MPYFTPAQIRDAYIEKLKYTRLSNNLKKPTEARIRNACIDTYLKKNTSSDKWILRNFLGVTEEKDLTVALKEDVGKFRPVVNFLKNKTEDPRDETIELIAWLIDFNDVNNDDEFQKSKGTEQLPPEEEESEKKLDNEVDLNDETTIVEIDGAISNIDSIPQKHEKPKSQFKIKIVLTICIILLVFGGWGFLFWKNKIDRQTITKDEKCMYWTGDHYEAVACKLGTSSPKIPLDTAVLHQLKKITVQDTLTKNSLGKVWYATINNRKEFFTDSGSHPVDTNKRLRPLTPYILSKYVSYHRYLLHIVIWNISIGISFIAMLYFVNRYMKRNVKN